MPTYVEHLNQYYHTMEMINIIEHCMKNSLNAYLQIKNIDHLQSLIHNIQRLVNLKSQVLEIIKNLNLSEPQN